MSSDKSKKLGRNTNKPSHKRAVADDRSRKNRIKREIKNLKENPKDLECFNRLVSYLANGGVPIGQGDLVRSVVDSYRKVLTHNL